MMADARLTKAQAIPISEIAERLDLLSRMTRSGREWEGPCPVCGGNDRFSISPDKGVYNCRACGGGDGLGLVQHTLACDFAAALSWLVGEREVEISPEERNRREREAADKKRQRDERAARERQRAIDAARQVWAAGYNPAGSPVEAYLTGRGLPPSAVSLPPTIRYAPDLPYVVKVGSEWVEIHRGPAMLAGILAPNGHGIGVHRTWIDADQPGRKARIVHEGEEMPAKKVLGSVKGGAIRLSHHACKPGSFQALVMGEGIETTLSALAADPVPGAAYWAGVSLGNMGGRRITRGEGMRYAGYPDLDDTDAFVPPPWVRRLLFIQDGDSAPKLTRAKLLSGLRRARAANGRISAEIVHAGDGLDLNDVLTGKGSDHDG